MSGFASRAPLERVLDTALDRANDPKASYRAALRRKEKARARGRKFHVNGRMRFGGVNPDRREKRSVCRMFGISGKRYRAL